MKANVFALVGLLIITLPIEAAPNQPNITALVASERSNVKIDLNKADVETLSKAFKGIGKKRAEAIIKYRESHGGFKSVEELSQVKGLGKQFVKNHLKQLQAVFMVN